MFNWMNVTALLLPTCEKSSLKASFHVLQILKLFCNFIMHTSQVLILLVSCILFALSNVDDYQVILSHSGINKLVQHFIPILKQELMTLTFPPQSLSTGSGLLSASVEIDEISVSNISIHNVTVNFNQETQKIRMDIINLNLYLNRFKFQASAVGFDGCSGYMTPEILNWNFSLTFNLTAHNCSIYINLIKDSTVISEGIMNLNKETLSTVCAGLVTVVDFFADIDQLIQDELVDAIPELVSTELQDAINGFLNENANEVGDIRICYGNITIYTQHLLIAGDLITPKNVPQVGGDEITTTPFIEDDGPVYDDASLFVFGLVILVLSCLCGCGIGSAIYCGCNKEKFKELKEYQAMETDDHDGEMNKSNIEAQRIKVADDMTDASDIEDEENYNGGHTTSKS